jgi:hypothetical protein
MKILFVAIVLVALAVILAEMTLYWLQTEMWGDDE